MYVWKHDYVTAETIAREGIRHATEAHWVELLRAQQHFARRDADSALTLFQRNVLDLPNIADAWLGLGETLVHMGWYIGHSPQEALAPFERLIRLDSAFAPIQYHVADLYLYSGDTAAARRSPASSSKSRLSRASAEQPVQEPQGRAAAAVADHAFAIDPVAPAGFVLDPVIIAKPRGRPLAPPFRRDPLRPLDPRDVVD